MSRRPQPTAYFSPQLDPSAQFRALEHADWMAAVERGLKSERYDEQLLAPDLDGIEIGPLYSENDAPRAMACEAALTGDRPSRGWTICQCYDHPDPTEVNRQILQDLERGAEGISLRFDRATQRGWRPDHPEWAAAAGLDGIMLATPADLDRILEGVQLEMVHLAIDAGRSSNRVAEALRASVERRGLPKAALRLALDFDPLAKSVEAEYLQGAPAELDRIATLAGVYDTAWHAARVVAVSTLDYHAAGASPAQELAFALATATQYLRAMSDAGMDAASACDHIRFAFAVDSDFFGSVAKLRAARRLWCRLLRALEGNAEQAGPMQVHAIGSPRTAAAEDPWVNLLRGTHQAVAAVVGGADQLTLQPFDHAFGPAGDLGRRLAVNTQSILQLESQLQRLADPAGGSYYVEWRTDALAREGWRRYQDIERAGGMLASLEAGSVQAAVAETAARRQAQIDAGEQPLIGVTRYPPPETMQDVDRSALDLESLRRQALARFASDEGGFDLTGQSGASHG